MHLLGRLRSGNFASRVTLWSGTDQARAVTAADIKGGSGLDVLFAGSGGNGAVAVLENLGTSWGLRIVSTASPGARSVAAADLDGDADLDVLVASASDHTIAWFENLPGGPPYFGAKRVISAHAGGATAVFAADVDGDGDQDVLSSSSNDAKISWYENVDGRGTFGVEHVISTNAAGAQSVIAADFDEDEKLDVVSASSGDDKIAWYRGKAGPQKRKLVEVLRPVDRDLDGQPDVRTTFEYYENGRGFSNANSLGHGEQLAYDLYRKGTRITDGRGFVTSHYYDQQGTLTKVAHPDGGVMAFEHNADALRWERTDPLGMTTQYSYCTEQTLSGCASNSGGNVTRQKDPSPFDYTIDYEYGAFDQITEVKDRKGDVRTLTYYTESNPSTGALEGKLHQVKLAQLGTASDVLLQEFKYVEGGALKEQIDYFEPGDADRKRRTIFTYEDDLGLNVEQIEERGEDSTGTTRSRTRSFTYDLLGRVESVTVHRRTSPTNATLLDLTTVFEYDDLDRVIRVTDPRGSQTETTFDANGNVIEVRFIARKVDNSGYEEPRIVEQRVYDNADRLIEIRDVNEEPTFFEYDEVGNSTRITDPTGASVSFEYDSRNRMVATVDANGYRTRHVYDLAGRLIGIVDPNGNRTSVGYDELGRRTSVADEMGHTTTFGYDANGSLESIVNANANEAPSDETLRNAFDVTLYQEYDELGRLIRSVDAMDEETRFEYDLLGNRTKVTDARDGVNGINGVTESVYDELGRLRKIIDRYVSTSLRHLGFEISVVPPVWG